MCSSTTKRRKRSRSRNWTRSSTSTSMPRCCHEHAQPLPLVCRRRLPHAPQSLLSLASARVRAMLTRTPCISQPTVPRLLPPRRHHDAPRCARRLTNSRHNSKSSAPAWAVYTTRTQTRTASRTRASRLYERRKREQVQRHRRRRRGHPPHIIRKPRHKPRHDPRPVPYHPRNPPSHHNLPRRLACRLQMQHQHRHRHRPRNRGLGPSRQRLCHHLYRRLLCRGPRNARSPHWRVTLKTLRSGARSRL